MSKNENLLNAAIDDIKRGYIQNEEYYSCLFCDKRIEKGVIYQQDGILYEAEKYMKSHIVLAHGSVFEYLINMDKKLTGLSEHQKGLLELFYQGKSDAEVQKELGIGSSSTVRNHRFVLKEKERQAKLFLVLMEMLREKDKKPQDIIEPHKTATMVDDRYRITKEENDKILLKYFPKGLRGPLKTFDMKEKSKLVVLRQIIKHFDEGRTYSEKEVNQILSEIYNDFATIRRYLIEYGFMSRKQDCSLYWVKGSDVVEDKNMDRKKELIQQYKEIRKEAGVYQIRNIKNNKVLVVGTPDFKTINGKRFELKMGSHMNKQLQAEWNEYGEDAFAFEVLEVLEEKEEGFFNQRDELKKLEAKWLEKLQPYGERGYNKEKK